MGNMRINIVNFSPNLVTQQQQHLLILLLLLLHLFNETHFNRTSIQLFICVHWHTIDISLQHTFKILLHSYHIIYITFQIIVTTYNILFAFQQTHLYTTARWHLQMFSLYNICYKQFFTLSKLVSITNYPKTSILIMGFKDQTLST